MDTSKTGIIHHQPTGLLQESLEGNPVPAGMEGMIKKQRFGNSLFKNILTIAMLSIVVVVSSIFLTLIIQSFPSIKRSGWQFITGTTWNPVTNIFGAAPFLTGTLLTSFVALLFSIPFSLSVALFCGEYYRRGRIAGILNYMIDLIAGIPSVIYGFWGLFILVPLVRKWEIHLGIAPYGVGIMTASLILSVMIIPYAASMGREIVKMVPSELKEAAYALGATRFEVIRYIIIPQVSSGLLAGILLSLGRALGETMAVTMVIGNTNRIPHNLFATGNTMASVIANEFTEASGTVYLSALMEIGLLLFVLTALINMLGSRIIKHLTH